MEGWLHVGADGLPAPAIAEIRDTLRGLLRQEFRQLSVDLRGEIASILGRSRAPGAPACPQAPCGVAVPTVPRIPVAPPRLPTLLSTAPGEDAPIPPPLEPPPWLDASFSVRSKRTVREEAFAPPPPLHVPQYCCDFLDAARKPLPGAGACAAEPAQGTPPRCSTLRGSLAEEIVLHPMRARKPSGCPGRAQDTVRVPFQGIPACTVDHPPDVPPRGCSARASLAEDFVFPPRRARELPGAPGRAKEALDFGPPRRLIASAVAHPAFDVMAMLLAAVNAVAIGYSAEYFARHPDAGRPDALRTIDIISCAAFTLELLMRALAYGRGFFRASRWNGFDFCCLLLMYLEEVFLLAVVNARFLRFVRFSRALRILRSTRHVSDLHVLLSCVSSSMKFVGEALVLLLILIYCGSIFLTSSVMAALADNPDDHKLQELEYWYGTVLDTMLSLFQALSDGVDWNDLVRPLFERVSLFAGFLALAWIVFASIVVMNVMAGIFVDSAIQHAQIVRDQASMEKAKQLFQGLDVGFGGTVNVQDLLRRLECTRVNAFFADLGVSTASATLMVSMLNEDEDGEVYLTDFLDGCIRLQRNARAMDVLLLFREQRSAAEEIARGLEERLEVLLAKLHEKLPSTP